MAVFRVEKTRDYTIMSNHHLKNKQLTLKAKGLMCVMLSLPDDWDYTLSGLQKISREGQDAIRQALHELEKCGYLVRNRIRDEKGHLTDMEYVIYEQPHLPEAAAEPPASGEPAEEEPTEEEPTLENPTLVNPVQENPIQGNSAQDCPTQENPMQLNTHRQNTYPKRKNESIPYAANPYPSIPHPSNRGRKCSDSDVGIVYQARATVKEQIEYDILCEQYDRSRLDEIVALMVDVRCGRTDHYTISEVEYPAELVRERFAEITCSHIEYIMDCLNKQTRRIGNIRAYLLTTLFNATETQHNYYDAMVRHDHPCLTLGGMSRESDSFHEEPASQGGTLT